jgi:pseudaminic acid biosynthesis-associated methylase
MASNQEKFWKGNFGKIYSRRNKNSNKEKMFRLILPKMKKVESVFEFGTNIGKNLDAIKKISPKTVTAGLEINSFAAKICAKKGHKIVCSSIIDFKTNEKYDLTFTCGVLIHVNPAELPKVYKKIFDLSKKYILIEEYFNPEPVSINYRGHKNKLFKRDFGKEISKKFNLKIIDYGFFWSEDKKFNISNTNWFLFKK